MTFTFTLDAFPGYTKFDPTRKVLAAIQVITDEDDNFEATREPCGEGLSVYSNAVNAKFVSNSASAAVIDVTGNVEGRAYNTEWFGTQIANGAQVSIQMPVEADEVIYEVKTPNPAYAKYYPSLSPTKTQEVTGRDLSDGGVAIILASDTPGDVTLEVAKKNGGFNKVYTIQNNITYADAAIYTEDID